MTIVYGRRKLMVYQHLTVTTDTPDEMERVKKWLEYNPMIANKQTYRHMGTSPGVGDDAGKYIARFIRLNEVVADSERGDAIRVDNGQYTLKGGTD